MIALVKCPAADDTKMFCSKGCEHYHRHEWTSEWDDCPCCDATGCREVKLSTTLKAIREAQSPEYRMAIMGEFVDLEEELL